MVDWQGFAEKWAVPEACKGKVFKKEFRPNQMQFVSTNDLRKRSTKQ